MMNEHFPSGEFNRSKVGISWVLGRHRCGKIELPFVDKLPMVCQGPRKPWKSFWM